MEVITMRKLIILSIVLALVFTAIVPAFAKGKQGQVINTGGSYVSNNSRHSQVLGGRSTHASRGLGNASQHSGAISGTENGSK
jgi:hypothetical protein